MIADMMLTIFNENKGHLPVMERVTPFCSPHRDFVIFSSTHDLRLCVINPLRDAMAKPWPALFLPTFCWDGVNDVCSYYVGI